VREADKLMSNKRRRYRALDLAVYLNNPALQVCSWAPLEEEEEEEEDFIRIHRIL